MYFRCVMKVLEHHAVCLKTKFCAQGSQFEVGVCPTLSKPCDKQRGDKLGRENQQI